MILAADGWKGLFGRGLRTRIFANALQSIIFTVIWRGLAERWGTAKDESTTADRYYESGGNLNGGIRGAQTIIAKPTHDDPEELIDLPNHHLEHRQLNDTAV